MNVLVIGGGSWDDTSSLGNTFSNLFADWGDTNFYNLYFRDVMPNNSVCKDYFRITTKDILKNYLNPSKIGVEFEYTKTKVKSDDSKGAKEKKLISIIHRYGLKSIYELEDRLWYSKKWINNNLDQFIKNANPDIVFAFAAGNSYMVLPIEYIKRKTNAKVVLFIADDVHTTYRMNDDKHHIRMQQDLDKQIKMADKVYGISDEMCSYYSELYNIEVSPLYKGCSFENEPMNTLNKPLKMVYAGNLLFGRYNTLVSLIEVMDVINKEEKIITLDIYSGTIITEEEKKYLKSRKGSNYHGEIDYTQVKQRMAEADIVLHVESFDEEQIKKVRYSFSTKIIDCLQSGSVMLAIGPKGISSIEYSKRIPGAVTIDNPQNIKESIYKLIDEGEALIERAKEIRNFAVANHGIESVRNGLKDDFETIVTY